MTYRYIFFLFTNENTNSKNYDKGLKPLDTIINKFMKNMFLLLICIFLIHFAQFLSTTIQFSAHYLSLLKKTNVFWCFPTYSLEWKGQHKSTLLPSHFCHRDVTVIRKKMEGCDLRSFEGKFEDERRTPSLHGCPGTTSAYTLLNDNNNIIRRELRAPGIHRQTMH